jgi:hypothetical protein
MLTADQLALAIDNLRPCAKYRRYDTYENLAATWEDSTTCPTEAELEAVWEELQINRLAAEIEAKYKHKLDDLKDLIVGTLATGGDGMDTKLTSLRTKYNEVKSKKVAEWEELYNG